VNDFELQALGLVESGGLRHPDREKGIGRSRLAHSEWDELRGPSGQTAQTEDGKTFIAPARDGGQLGRRSTQKSGFAARGTAETLPAGSLMFSAHMRSVHPPTAGR
jgi:hypothetical protein